MRVEFVCILQNAKLVVAIEGEDATQVEVLKRQLYVTICNYPGAWLSTLEIKEG